MERHFTATVYIFWEEMTLLHQHAKLGKWLPPGGHIEPGETPPEAARREVKEETGLNISFLEQENLKIEAYNGTSFERPFLCLLEHIPARGAMQAHEHMDLIYIARPSGETLPDVFPNGFRWFSYTEIENMEEKLFPDSREVLRLLLKEQGLERLFHHRRWCRSSGFS